jgi:hypothetical protein
LSAEQAVRTMRTARISSTATMGVEESIRIFNRSSASAMYLTCRELLS